MKSNTVKARPIQTARLSLRQFIEGDEISMFHEYCGNIEASKFLQRLPHRHIEQTKQMFENWSGTKWNNIEAEFIWIIAEKNTNLAIGLVMFINKLNNSKVLDTDTPKNYGEIHFGLAPKFQGQGFMFEAIKAVIKYVKDTSKLQYLKTFCDLENVPSQNVLLKSGFEKNEIIKSWVSLPAFGDEARDCVSFKLDIA